MDHYQKKKRPDRSFSTKGLYMCLQTSKQAYSFLQAFKEAGEDGLSYSELIDKIVAVGKRDLNAEIKSYTPTPLATLFSRHLALSAISQIDRGKFVITNDGLAGLATLTKVAIEPYKNRIAVGA